MAGLLWILAYSIIAVVVLATACILALLVYIHHIHNKYAHIPGPARTSFIFGNISDIVDAKRKGKLSSDLLVEWVEQHGTTIVVFFFWIPFVYIHTPEGVKELLSDNHPKSVMVYRHLQTMYGAPFMGSGLVTVIDQDLHARNRALFNPVFHRSYLKTCINQFNSSADLMVDWLMKRADGKTKVRMLDTLNTTALDIIGKVAFGMDLQLYDGTEKKFLNAIKLATEAHEILATSSPMTTMRRKYFPFHAEREYQTNVQESCNFLRDTGRRCITKMSEDIKQGKDVPDNLLSNLLRSTQNGEQVMQMEEMLDEFVTFFFAGQETTANLLSTTLMEIGRRPEIFYRLRTEVDAILGDKLEISYEDGLKLEYTMAVLKESLRLHPPAIATVREAAYDVNIDGYNVPKGSVMMVQMYVMSRMARYFNEPLQYDPDRFLAGDDNIGQAFFPFSSGSRNCIGQHFALIEARIVLAKLIKHFNMELVPDQSFEMEKTITIKPKDGCMMYLKPV